MQDPALQVNRPQGWGFQNVTNGEIKYMKLWQVSLSVVRHVPQIYQTSPSLAHRLEL